MARPENDWQSNSLRITAGKTPLTLMKLAAASRNLNVAQFILNCALKRLEGMSFDIEEGQPPKKLAEMSPTEVDKAVSFAEKLLEEMRKTGKGEPSK